VTLHLNPDACFFPLNISSSFLNNGRKEVKASAKLESTPYAFYHQLAILA
jgi:hypothetical protein